MADQQNPQNPQDQQAQPQQPQTPPQGGQQQSQQGEGSQSGQQPVRPGQQVPDGGLDPSQVFAAPPQAPQQQSQQQGQQQAPQQGEQQGAPGQEGQQPQDTGPAPPPPGQALPGDEELKAQGYDDEDIRVLKEVGDYRFGSISSQLSNKNIVLPDHPETQFDEDAFLTLLRGSISLTRDEKWRIIQALPKLSQFQIDELRKILEEEKRKFSQLSPKHLLQLKKLEERHSEDWKDLQSITQQESAKQHEEKQADEIRKQLGL